MNNIKKIFIRGSHILVYDYEINNQYEFNNLQFKLSTLKKIDKNGKELWRPDFKAMLMTLDPSNKKVLRLPREVPLYLIKNAWPMHEIFLDDKSWPKKYTEVNLKESVAFKNITQRRMFDFLLNNKSNTIGLETPTASGKSFVALAAWCERKTNLSAIFAQKIHMENFKEEILKHTTIQPKEICIIQGKESISKAIKKIDQYKVFLIMTKTFASVLSKFNFYSSYINPVSDFIFKTKSGLVIFDEAHLELKSMLQISMLINVEEILYMSATAHRTDSYENKILAMQIPQNNTLTIKPEKRHHIRVQKYELDIIPEISSRFVVKGDYFQSSYYFRYITKNTRYFDFLLELITKQIKWSFQEKKHKCVALVLSSALEELNLFAENIKRIFSDKTVGVFTSEISNIEKRSKELDVDIIITTEKSFAGSLNVLKLEHLILLAHLQSKVVVEQIVGRLRGIDGNECIVTDMVDISNRNILDQFKSRLSLYKKRLSDNIVDLPVEKFIS